MKFGERPGKVSGFWWKIMSSIFYLFLFFDYEQRWLPSAVTTRMLIRIIDSNSSSLTLQIKGD